MTTNADDRVRSTTDSTVKKDKQEKLQQQKLRPAVKYSILTLIHIFVVAVYLIPILTHPYEGGPVLDESHIIGSNNADVAGTTSLHDVFINDYWGRPMDSESSHKSWRPVTILTFRYLQGSAGYLTKLTMHRITNILAHAATGECVSLLAVKLFSSHFGSSEQSLFLLRCLTKLFFCLHPTHVEVTANAANRPHLLAVLCAAVLCDPSLNILLVMLVQIIGLLCSETFLFQMPAVCITLTAIYWKQHHQHDPNAKHPTPFHSIWTKAVVPLLPRHMVLFLLSVSYLVMRFWNDWLSIPTGLIRPAENPFFPLTGLSRVRNYALVVVIHISKSWNLDLIGFSHEYGHACLPELTKWTDPRFGVVLATIGLFGYVTYKCMVVDNGNNNKRLNACLLLLFHLSWMATLFPISGIVKVGTFIADRIVVGSTVSVSILVGRYLTTYIMPDEEEATIASGKTTDQQQQKKKSHPLRRRSTLVVVALFCFMWYRVHFRSMEWMDSVPLLTSSLKSCPRSAKSHLEISKIYSGLVPHLFDLDQSLYHLNMVEEIDPTYCDVHQQFAHVYIQQSGHKLLDFEERLAKAILCPFTMGGATEMWRRYWPVVLKDPSTAIEGQKRIES
eukprot:CAMPEP_0119020324 /NCGR_PEP_ID=MMETSP1176-20130426/23812_1 /TAXON_ID=265551 /ORGANISM="Synedropsis recta cf, Strain CCMP1620" /LENGTH=615 /DNA_ID=CAMNT_0006974731 /DNA_START=187 /DNA_END=2030 /DNA_ORIENTATION=+